MAFVGSLDGMPLKLVTDIQGVDQVELAATLSTSISVLNQTAKLLRMEPVDIQQRYRIDNRIVALNVKEIPTLGADSNFIGAVLDLNPSSKGFWKNFE